MKYSYSLRPWAVSLLGLLLAFTVLCSRAFAGTDSYRIYLNSKLLTQQYAGQPFSISNLQLGDAGNDAMLVVFYNHCGEIGKARKISLKDEQGNVLKEWTFADAAGKDAGMSIPVKELLALQKKTPHLSLFYAASQLPSGRMLMGVTPAKTTAWQPAKAG
ncbi:hypothetical protein [Deminuibacter soli]|uniref:Uncharacterized protein n=1 Tax=Deminuibacter soli TaxID=2291815 RepID=A0A3E1NK57_9BACT|nr:hypothetical protein [Deminuibacter soli]RFM28312.1 hypothetical protein DXN05_12435 [Deminuibacter soli]